MNQKPLSKKPQHQKRPVVLAAFCILYLLLFIWNLVKLITPSGYSTAIIELPAWFVIIQLTIFYPIGIVSLLGVWFMRRWGFFVFCSLMLLSWLLMLFGLNVYPQTGALFLALVFFATGSTYLWQMK